MFRPRIFLVRLMVNIQFITAELPPERSWLDRDETGHESQYYCRHLSAKSSCFLIDRLTISRSSFFSSLHYQTCSAWMADGYFWFSYDLIHKINPVISSLTSRSFPRLKLHALLRSGQLGRCKKTLVTSHLTKPYQNPKSFTAWWRWTLSNWARV